MSDSGGADEKLQKILNSPEAMQKIMEIVRDLSAGEKSGGPADGGAASGESAGESGTAETAGESGGDPGTAEAGNPEGDMAALSGLLSGLPEIASVLKDLNIKPETLGGVGRALKAFGESERRIELLKAVRPFASGKNAETLDRAVLAIKVAKAARNMMGGDGDITLV